jgi:hypothetical protein
VGLVVENPRSAVKDVCPDDVSRFAKMDVTSDFRSGRTSLT